MRGFLERRAAGPYNGFGIVKGLIIAAPHSGAGKTMVTLGLLRALRQQGIAVRSAKSGPDYIDPQFHGAASGADCVNLDAWAMSAQQVHGLATEQSGDLLIVEGAMGLFDGAPDTDPLGKGSCADLAAMLDLPVVLVLDAAKQAQTAAAVVAGLAGFRADVNIAGVILNRIGSPRHADMLTRAIEVTGVPVLGAVPRTTVMQTPSRHLGLVQASERGDLERFIARAAALISEHVNLSPLVELAKPLTQTNCAATLQPLGQNIAVARDDAFAFAYPHILDGWRRAGAAVSFFSPLNDEGPAGADAIYLPGGYPELHAATLANNQNFRTGMDAARANNTLIYGECGGYMTLGEHLTDADGIAHRMLGYLPVSTSFEAPKLHLGYRHLTSMGCLPWGPLKGHEFHYASVTQAADGGLFSAADSMGTKLPDMGHIDGNVCGSFAHIIA